jgi:hypothetical protein
LLCIGDNDVQEGEGDNDVQEGEVLGAVADGAQKFVTAREYYCFKMQVRRGIFNIILFGGRLFQ